jgi:hypothetical protein
MTDFVHVDRRTFRRNASGGISAGLWFNFGQAAFPDDGWDDFAAAVLAAAVEAVQRLLKGTSDTEKVLLMEGPYHLGLEMADEAYVTISAIHRMGSQVIVEHEQIISVVALAVDLCAAAEQLLSWCRPVGWIGRDEVQLEQGVAALLATIAGRAN